MKRVNLITSITLAAWMLCIFAGGCQKETDKERLMSLCDEKYDLGHCETACNHGVAAACNIMGQQYEWGVKEIADTARSLEFYRRACHLGRAVACCQAAGILASGRIKSLSGGQVPVNRRAARYYADRSCKLGHELCCERFSEDAREKGGADRALLPDGAYLVLGSAVSAAELKPVAEQRVVEFGREFAEKDAAEPPEFLLVGSQPDVPLDLAKPAVSGKTDDGKTFVRLSLAPEAAERLETFTANQVGKGSSVAIIIGGRVVTRHKVRAKIEGGKLQISCCAENACEFLLKNLEDNL